MRFVFCFLSCLILSSSAIALDSYADLVEQMMPSVVNISTTKESVAQEENVDNLMLNADFSGRESLGSGFFIRPDGYILTNLHIIKGAKTIRVITNDEKSYKAKLVAIDSASDLAVLKINPQKGDTFKSVIFGDADLSRVGDIVLTFGNPYGLGISVSQGIISAKSRRIDVGEQQYIQTDAAINEGNSGGPMFDLDGKVIGINTAIFTVKGASGIGFALPANVANWVSSQLISKGKVHRGWLGIEVADGVDERTLKTGFVITEISELSQAYQEGIRVGDIITSYNDKPAQDADAFRIYTETMEPGRMLKLKTTSLGEEYKHTLRVQEMPKEELKSVTNKALKENAQYNQHDLGKDVFYISELGIGVKEAYPRGLMIVKLERKSPLYGKGIKEGDIILEADREDIYSPNNLLDSIRNAIVDDFRPVSLFVQGTDDPFYVEIEVTKEDD